MYDTYHDCFGRRRVRRRRRWLKRRRRTLSQVRVYFSRFLI
jgi:hypothetical protein